MRIFCILLFFCIYVDAGTKRDRTEMESSLSSDAFNNRIRDILNSLAGRAGSKIDWVRTITKDDNDLRYYFLSLGQLEVAAFEILLSHPDMKSDDILALLNSRIDVSRTVSKRVFDLHRVSFWRHLLLKIDFPSAAQYITSNIQIVETDDGVSHLNLSDNAWDEIVVAWLLRINSQQRLFLPQMPTVQLPRPIGDFETLLPPLARMFILQSYWRNGIPTDARDRMARIRLFDPRSVLFQRMREYMLTIDSLGYLDPEAVAVLREAHATSDAAALADTINSRFNHSNPPAMNLLYTAERLQGWLNPVCLVNIHVCAESTPINLPQISRNIIKNRVRDPVRLWPPNRLVHAQHVRLEWEQHERVQAGLGRVIGGIDTRILERPFDVNYKLVIPNENRPSQGQRFPSKEAQKRVLSFFLRMDPLQLRLRILDSSIQAISDSTGSNITHVVNYMNSLLNRRYIAQDIANELTRINRNRIITTPEIIIQDAIKRGVTTKLYPEEVLGFYNLMMESIRAHPNEKPFKTIINARGLSQAYISYAIWRNHFLLPILNELSSQ